MKKSFVLSMISLAVVSSPGVLLGDDRLDAPGPGYRHQVERFAPKGREPRPFQLEIISPFGPLVSEAAAGSLNVSNPIQEFPGSAALPAPSDLPDFSQSIEVEQFAPKETEPRLQIQIISPFGPTKLYLEPEAAAGSLNVSEPIQVYPALPATSDLPDFSQPIRLFDAPHAPASKLLPDNSPSISPKKSP